MFQLLVNAALRALLWVNLAPNIFAKEVVSSHTELNKRMLQEALSNMSIEIGKELEHLHRESSKVHHFLVDGLQSRNISLDHSYFLEVNKTMDSFLHNITVLIDELEEIRERSSESKIQSFNDTTNISRFTLGSISSSQPYHELVRN